MGTGHWKANDALKLEDKEQILTHDYVRSTPILSGAGVWEGGTEVVFDLYGVVLISTLNHSLCLLIQNKKGDLYQKKFHNSKWSKSIKLQRAFLGDHDISYALLQPHLYVSTNWGINCINIEEHTHDGGQKLTVTSIPSAPLAKSTICGVNNSLFSLGGMDEDGQPSSDIFRYNPSTQEWEPGGYMRSSRCSITVSPFLRDKENTDVIAVGGVFGEDKDNNPPTMPKCRITEICEVGFSCE